MVKEVRISKKEAEERREYIISILEEAKGEPVNGEDLAASLQMTQSGFYMLMQRLMRKDPRIRSARNGQKKFNDYILDAGSESPVGKEEKAMTSEPERPDGRYDDTRNDEGYPDPTMFAVLRKTGNTGKIIEPGEIWEIDNGVRSQLIVVLKKFNSTVNYVILYDDPEIVYDAERIQCKAISALGKKALVNVVRVNTKPFKTDIFKKHVGKLDDSELKKLRAFIGSHLGINGVGVVEVPVVKEIKVPVPAPAPVPAPIQNESETRTSFSEKEVQSMIVEAIRDTELRIYKDVTEKLLAKQ